MSISFLKALTKRKIGWVILVALTGLLLLTLRILPAVLLDLGTETLKLGWPDYGYKGVIAILALQFGLQAAIGYYVLRYMPRGEPFYVVLRLVVIGMVVLAFVGNWPWIFALLLGPIGPNPEGLFGWVTDPFLHPGATFHHFLCTLPPGVHCISPPI